MKITINVINKKNYIGTIYSLIILQLIFIKTNKLIAVQIVLCNIQIGLLHEYNKKFWYKTKRAGKNI